MPKKKQYVRYLTKKHNSAKIEEFGFATIVVESEGVKRYFNTLGVLARLSKGERLLLDYILEEMDEHNFVTNNKQLRTSFNKLMTRFGLDAYTASTINKYFSNLQKHCLIERAKGRGVYQVSPSFYFKGNQKERAACIRRLLEAQTLDPISKIRRGYFVRKKPS